MKATGAPEYFIQRSVLAKLNRSSCTGSVDELMWKCWPLHYFFLCRCLSQPERTFLPLVQFFRILPSSQRLEMNEAIVYIINYLRNLWIYFLTLLFLGAFYNIYFLLVCIHINVFQQSLLREFLLTKLINAEISCYKAQQFSRLEVKQ